ncbi:bifunctional 4-hydroxy-2-oxoglutarate aldolase/2-dehydro-3-deoxy-phosphogluconate aldolase [Dyadobacter sediminis]|uniref:Bifunctional 4-hydroxy-2-oxoglutarate aldolase/2-dehydro-3-deoxy-phosphogluconate aldolase n=1 Tax=Dyadobacter sediminis TaxID=1493691 RepID=A0A5R9K6V7_9BACT|nr:bifunctional 4-hydroxy-2-oxoglutarate aldolase/2-dehydro-3-deoxy-phosphogluconate aldolase [Dyadobacter sediminis]TLU89526.1 bifunctional 4-hydroxy-2-oxoglutarate aldolase/2-dehydro-3-deoxy-phosphogluconate aldolase [Dyadobacter sediminis]GGC04633.1 bifunctional 4-hydroxy-2-oxoglutarate aldolase/2-dehydro-3-deoxy-phosphogluconate aldolase [Dyadobacter sediminis]
MDKDTILILLNEVGILPLFYHADIEIAKEVINASYRGGARAFEFTNRGDNAYHVFTELVAYTKESLPGLAMGIGTIYDVETAQKFIEAGADFIVTPCLNPEVGRACAVANIPWIPGVSTLTEIYNAQQAGAVVVKLFPGDVVGSAFIKAIRGPMPKVKIMVTGGVQPTRESISEWFGAGAYAVGLGSNLFPKDVIAEANYSWIEQKIAESIALVKEFRSSN